MHLNTFMVKALATAATTAMQSTCWVVVL